MARARSTAGRLVAAAGALAALAAPASACPHCYGASSATVLEAYYLSTLSLSLLPFAVVGGLAAIAVRLARRGRSH